MTRPPDSIAPAARHSSVADIPDLQPSGMDLRARRAVSTLAAKSRSAAESMAFLRALLKTVGYTEDSVCERTGAASIYDFTSLAEGRPPAAVRDALDVLIRLFLDGELVEQAVARQHLPARAVRVLEVLGLLRAFETDSSQFVGRVMLYPTQGLWLISDLPSTSVGSASSIPVDAVYPAITENTRDFVTSIPGSRCERFLDMCAGTGIAALIAARRSGYAWAGDVTARATRFARFNAALNSIENFGAVQGDLYDPFRGRTFDRIVAHPPYVASAEQKMIYRDAGSDGERFTRALLAGLPEFLEPGGRFYMTCVATDRKNSPLEQRLRDMIGPMNADFDVVVAIRVAWDPSDYCRAVAHAAGASEHEADTKIAVYGTLGVEKLVYASVALARHAEQRPPFTARRSASTSLIGECLEWQLDWVRLRESPGFNERLLASRVQCRDGVRILAQQHMADRAWHIERRDVFVDTPFRTSFDCSSEMKAILSQCTEWVRVSELATRLTDDSLVGPLGAEDNAGALVSLLVSAGCLETELLPLAAQSPLC